LGTVTVLVPAHVEPGAQAIVNDAPVAVVVPVLGSAGAGVGTASTT
jgi:hypothetical protein